MVSSNYRGAIRFRRASDVSGFGNKVKSFGSAIKEVTIKIPDWLEKTAVFILLTYRRIRYSCAFRKIPLTKGKVAIVDPDDYYRLSRYKWHARPSKQTCYASRYMTINGKGETIWMHRLVLKAPKKFFVDHINRNGLDNRKANLRLATPSQNSCNAKRRKNVQKKYRGVFYSKQRKDYYAQIVVNRKRMHLGCFKNQINAAKAYDKAAKKHHGQFASLNFPPFDVAQDKQRIKRKIATKRRKNNKN